MNPNFIGLYHYSMDAKNRLAIPVKFRSEFNSKEGMVLSQGLEGCLNLYPAEAWKNLHEKLETMPLKNRIDQRAFKRMLFASACDVAFDEEGRILIPQALVLYAGVKRDAAIIGMGGKIEIWGKQMWESYRKKQKTAFARHASDLEI